MQHLKQLACVVFLTLSFALTARAGTTKINGESLVLAGTEPTTLLGKDVDEKTVALRSTHLPGGEQTVVYEAGKDYAVDAKVGTIARTKDSRIPDFATNVLYGKKDFDHSQFPGYGNLAFTIYVDYAANDVPEIAPKKSNVADLIPKTLAKLKAGEPLKVIAYGDSITAGGEASTVDLQYTPRWIAETLRKKFPKSDITFENGATGGDTSYQGIARLEEKVLSRKPDLVMIAFGMNDNNVGGTPIAVFQDNLRSMIKQIREKTGAEVILLSTFPPHPDWHFGTKQMAKYAEATKAVAEEVKAPYADVFGVYEKVLERKDPSSLLGNNINHPNDYGHWLYVVALDALEW